MKKVFVMILLLCLTFGVQVGATEVVEEPPAGQEMPAEAPVPQGQMPPRGERHQGQMPSQRQMPQGEMPQEQDGEQPVEAETMMTENDGENAVTQPGGAEMRGMPRMMESGEATPEPMEISGFLKTYATSVVSVVLLIGAFVFVKLYRRKNY